MSSETGGGVDMPVVCLRMATPITLNLSPFIPLLALVNANARAHHLMLVNERTNELQSVERDIESDPPPLLYFRDVQTVCHVAHVSHAVVPVDVVIDILGHQHHQLPIFGPLRPNADHGSFIRRSGNSNSGRRRNHRRRRGLCLGGGQ